MRFAHPLTTFLIWRFPWLGLHSLPGECRLTLQISIASPIG